MLRVVKIWILISTLLVVAGWVLSAIHVLNPAGYGVVFVLAVVAFFFWLRHTRAEKKSRQCLRAFLYRFKRPAPLLFLALAVLTLVGGLLYSPSNGSSAAYRIPRVMEWLAAGQWYWVHTPDVRMNIAGCGMEWFFSPLILLTHNDRLLFLPNWLSFLMLPGLVFSVLTRLRISSRVAWWWMWLLPSGWCFIMQAGSTINDSFATVYALAAIDFALRARESRNVGDVWYSMLAVALASGVKQSDVLLAIPGLIALWPNARLLLKRPLLTALVAGICLLISILPITVFNLKKTGNWAGVTVNDWGYAELHSPFWGIIGNIFCLTAQNLKPPVFPLVKPWDAARKHFLETHLGSHFTQFEDFGRLSFGVGESAASLGAGICLLTLISIFAARHYRRVLKLADTRNGTDAVLFLLIWTPWLLMLVFMAKVGTFESGRQFASHYILLFPLLLASSGHAVLVRQRWWKSLALLVMALAVSLLFISRDRPLFPAQTVIQHLEAKYPNSKFVANIQRTYSETPAFEEERIEARKALPKDEAVIGYASSIDGQAASSLWLPYGQRRVEYVLPEDTADQVRARGIHYVVVESLMLDMTQDTIQQWLARYNGVIVTQWQFLSNPYVPPFNYYLVRLNHGS